MSSTPPPVEPPRGLTRERALAVAGVAGLLIVAVAIIAMISGGGGDESEALPAAVTRTATPTPTETPEPKPTPPPLTSEQRAQREAAAGILSSRGFAPVKLRTYRGDHTLRVLIGKPANGAPGGRLAFFFVEDRYIGNDTTGTSYRLSVGRQSETRVTLRYGVYQPGDEACCPSETRSVRLAWDGQRLQPLDAIPDQSLRVPPAQ